MKLDDRTNVKIGKYSNKNGISTAGSHFLQCQQGISVPEWFVDTISMGMHVPLITSCMVNCLLCEIIFDEIILGMSLWQKTQNI